MYPLVIKRVWLEIEPFMSDCPNQTSIHGVFSSQPCLPEGGENLMGIGLGYPQVTQLVSEDLSMAS